MDKNDIKKVVREGYGEIAKSDRSCCGFQKSCCGSADLTKDISKNIGYSEDDIKSVPNGANLGLGCGNPIALASLKHGETVLDLGSGGGFDCFLAANKVGKKGNVIGVDMTPEMIEKAKQNAKKANYKNVDFRLGDIENLPVADNSVDVIISNCVINLAPDKKKAFKEAFRVLKQGGRLMVSDMVFLKELPESIRNSVEAYVGCIGGAILKDEYINAIKQAGFQNVKIIDKTPLPFEVLTDDPIVKAVVESLKMTPEKIKEVSNLFVSIKVFGTK